MECTITLDDIKSIFTKRPKECNKGDFGYVGVMGGCPLYSGAVKLANMANNAILTLPLLTKASLRSALQTVWLLTFLRALCILCLAIKTDI